MWDKSKPITKHINGYIEQLRENFETILDGYFDEFKGKMKNEMRIPMLVVDHYYDHIFFMVDTNFTYAWVVRPRIAWLRPMQYEVNVDEISVTTTTLLAEEIDNNAKTLNTYETKNIKILMQTKSS